MTNNQIGGTHYQTAIQPIDYITANNMGFCEGNVIKYVTRHKGKDGRQDIEKAIQYLDFILKYQYDNVPVKVDNVPVKVDKQPAKEPASYYDLTDNDILNDFDCALVVKSGEQLDAFAKSMIRNGVDESWIPH